MVLYVVPYACNSILCCAGDGGKLQELTEFVEALRQYETHICKPENENLSFLDFCQPIGYEASEFPVSCIPASAMCKNYEALCRILLQVNFLY